MSFLFLYVYFIALSFIVSLLVYSNQTHRYLKNFPPFLFATLVAEVIGSYLGHIGENNYFIYNFFTVIEFCFYMILISMIIRNGKVKMVIKITALTYFLIAISNILFFQGMKTFHTITYSLGCLVIVIVCIYYFFELFRMPKAIRLSVDPAFWICSGVLFFYCCGFPLYAFANFWFQYKWMQHSFVDIITILNIFLYSLFTIAFLCNRTQKHTSL